MTNIIDAVNESLDPIPFTPAQEEAAILRAQAGDRAAAAQILRNYFGLIVNEVTRLLRKSSGLINDREDARDEAFGDATIVFYRVLEAYRPGRGYFGGLLQTALRNDPAFTMVINRARAMTVPRATMDRRASILRAADGDVSKARALAPGFGMTVETFDAVTQVYQSNNTIEPYGEQFSNMNNRRTSNSEWLPEAARYSEPDYVRVEDLHDVRRALSILDLEERDVICGLFGLNGWPEHSQYELAAELGMSRQTIRRIRDRAMVKIRKQFETEE